jgi:uncharacterized small protein (DUF1192 family)
MVTRYKPTISVQDNLFEVEMEEDRFGEYIHRDEYLDLLGDNELLLEEIDMLKDTILTLRQELEDKDEYI